jgi:putative oxidoreductase
MKNKVGMRDVGVLVVRLTAGSLMAGHGAQKLFGAFGGHGLEGTGGWMESMGLKPGKAWAALAGASEFSGGLLTALGLLNPVGTLGTVGAMSMATAKVHWGKPVWATSGGAELPLIYSAIALGVGIAGPGKISVDNALGIKLPRRLVLVPGLLLTAGAVAAGLYRSNMAQLEQPEAQSEEQPVGEAEQSEHAAVRVAERPGAELQQESERAASEPNRVAGAELQAGQDAAHPI